MSKPDHRGGNPFGNPKRPPLDDERVEANAAKHVDLATVSDAILATELQLAEVGSLYEQARESRSYTPAAKLLGDVRKLQDKLLQLRAEEAATVAKTPEMQIEAIIMRLPRLPQWAQDRAREVLSGRREALH